MVNYYLLKTGTQDPGIIPKSVKQLYNLFIFLISDFIFILKKKLFNFEID